MDYINKALEGYSGGGCGCWGGGRGDGVGVTSEVEVGEEGVEGRVVVDEEDDMVSTGLEEVQNEGTIEYRVAEQWRRCNQRKMHSYGYRANALLTFALTILAVMCAMASLSDNLNSPSPTAHVQVTHINWFQKQPNGHDEVSVTMNISADLQSLFTWNTKQVFVFLAAEYETHQNSVNQISLWDGIIPSKDHAKFWIHTSNKYRFIDQGNNLRGKEFNLTMHWHVMPKTGKMFADKIVMPGYRLPEEYR
ncbi:hypothetical protein VNO78_20406 [Psophocarpus tetragonolobus]|uniref:Signal peptidase complex subunit 3 n=1 Tax=Psophocarpus tetragonolobus TaxID=3891 RepID=A0AAN9SA86_PSOTE